MAAKIGRGSSILIFLLGIGIVAYSLNRYRILKLKRPGSRWGAPSRGNVYQTKCLDTSASTELSPEVIPKSTSTSAREPHHDKPSLQEKIRRRAHELYLQRGGQAGSELDDWLRAEAEILQAKDAAIDEASEESFPASDAPAY